MEQRLIPINALIGLVQSDGLNQPVLAHRGYSLAGLEVTLGAGPDHVVADVVLANGVTGHLLPAEAKSGSNVDEAQARRYAAVDGRTVVRSSFVSLKDRVEPSAEVVYACIEGHADRVLLGLAKTEMQFPVLSIDIDKITLRNRDHAGEVLCEVFAKPLRLAAAPPRIIRFDPDSDVEILLSPVKAALVAALTHSQPEITVHSLAERATPHFAVYGRAAQQKLCKKVGQAAQRLAAEDSSTFEYYRRQGNHEGVVRLLRTPESNDPRGRTQGYQALGRRRSRRRPPQVHPDQLLLDELEMMEDGDKANAPANLDEPAGTETSGTG